MLAQEGLEAFARALFSGVVFVLAFANLFGGMRIFRYRVINAVLWLVVAGLAVMPGLTSTIVAGVMTICLYFARKRYRTALAQQAGS